MRRESRLSMMKKMKPNVMCNATEQTKKNYLIEFDY